MDPDKIADADFARIWDLADHLGEAAQMLGITEEQATDRAKRLRKRKVRLKRLMVRPQATWTRKTGGDPAATEAFEEVVNEAVGEWLGSYLAEIHLTAADFTEAEWAVFVPAWLASRSSSKLKKLALADILEPVFRRKIEKMKTQQ